MTHTRSRDSDLQLEPDVAACNNGKPITNHLHLLFWAALEGDRIDWALVRRCATNSVILWGTDESGTRYIL